MRQTKTTRIIVFLLVLSVAINPLTVTANLVHDQFVPSTLVGFAAKQPNAKSDDTQPVSRDHVATACGMPCCDESHDMQRNAQSCVFQTCVFHHSASFPAQIVSILPQYAMSHDYNTLMVRVHGREIRPDLPPPKFL